EVFEGARRAVCEGCGHRLDVGGRVPCAGCGAPLAPSEDAAACACPYCGSVLRRVAPVVAPGGAG
ncbi:MAG TPA: hypothetical protein VHB21_13705, partial [Minicystis sp.]|nr:hypothetical protein [Minicystis sp.]